MLWSGLHGTTAIGSRCCSIPARKPGEAKQINISPDPDKESQFSHFFLPSSSSSSSPALVDGKGKQLVISSWLF